mmetsp:Transcript_898/g.1362  ORF Transcript_898/g.1362 Transcript_898/m.1362 type:complete len:228 (-) Transcript_898:102-785(-)
MSIMEDDNDAFPNYTEKYPQQALICSCPQIMPPVLNLDTKLILIMHRYETIRRTATAPLATRCLTNHELYIHGYSDNCIDLTNLIRDPTRRTLLLYPGETARPLTHKLMSEDSRPVNLIVPDGSWRQAHRMAKRIPGLDQAELVTLPEGGPDTQWNLRREPKVGGLATFEAIARAYGILESANVQEKLEQFFHKTIEMNEKGEQGSFYTMRKQTIEAAAAAKKKNLH